MRIIEIINADGTPISPGHDFLFEKPTHSATHTNDNGDWDISAIGGDNAETEYSREMIATFYLCDDPQCHRDEPKTY